MHKQAFQYNSEAGSFYFHYTNVRITVWGCAKEENETLFSVRSMMHTHINEGTVNVSKPNCDIRALI